MKNSKLFFSNLLLDNFSSCNFLLKYIFIFGLFTNLLALTMPIFSMQVLDRVLTSQNLNTLLMLILISTFLLLILFFMQNIRFFIMNKIGSLIEKKLSRIVFHNSIKDGIDPNLNNNQSLRDLQIIKSFLISSSLICIVDIPWSLIFIFFAFFLHKSIGILVISSIIILILINLIFESYNSYFSKLNNKYFFNSMYFIEEANRNSEVLVSMGMISDIYINWQKIHNLVQFSRNKMNILNYIFTEVLKLTRFLIQIFTLSLGAFLVIKGHITSGSIIASSYIVSKSLSPFEYIVNYWKTILMFKGAYQRIFILLSKQKYLLNRILSPLCLGEISVKNIYFNAFNNTKHIIKNLSFYLNSGEILGISGDIGSGKTILIKIIMGILNPSMGSITIDGLDLHSWQNKNLSRNIGYLPEEVDLFSDTIKKNISRMRLNFNYNKIIIASKIAGAHDMILRLPNNYNYFINKRSSFLSAGEKRIIALARAFYDFPKIIFLDEPENFLDSKYRENLITSIFTAKENNITTIVVTKNKFLLNIVDKILVIKGGKIVSFGNSDNIITRI